MNSGPVARSWWKPTVGVSFDWVLSSADSVNFSASVVDIDAFEATAETVAKLHAQGKKVIGYVSLGTFENTRPDLSLLPAAVIGNVYPEYPEEKWIDIRQIDKIKPWIISRFKMISDKHFDALEPDNLDGYSNNSGFKLSLTDTRNFCDSIIAFAHNEGLGIGQKNVPELSVDYSQKFDWALTEDAYNQGWANQMTPYIAKDKPVFTVEYTDMTSPVVFDTKVCPDAKLQQYTAILKNRSLDSYIYRCK